jgi:hypothetical protein
MSVEKGVQRGRDRTGMKMGTSGKRGYQQRINTRIDT